MKTEIIHKIAGKLNFSERQVASVSQLQSEGATIPFMARYRKEVTGNLDEVQISAVMDELKYFSELDKRKETVIKTIEAGGKLTAELRSRIDRCFDATELEDIYLPYKPKRKTRAAAAIEKGLEPLASLIFAQGPGSPATDAANFLNEQVADISVALQGASDIIAEWISEHEQSRNSIRKLFLGSALLTAKILPAKQNEEAAKKYLDYFNFSEKLANSPSHRILAIRRGEKEGFLSMDISIDKSQAIAELEKIFRKGAGEKTELVTLAITDGFERMLKSSIETEFRVISKNKADEEATRVFVENFRQLLLASPLGAQRVLAVDPGFRTGCKLVCLDQQGNFLHNATIFPHPPQQEIVASEQVLKQLVSRFDIQAIGIGNGTAGRETEQLVRNIDFGRVVNLFMVSESGASIYSASEVAREEFPDQDVTVRGTISIGRRLMDPLSELVKIEPKSIGVGQYQHDVNQTKLKEELDRTVESCVNHVGVDLNTASRHLLTYVSGLSATLAKNIVQYRTEHGAFRSRESLKKVSLMGPKSFEQCAGFLRIREGVHPLDNSAVHPESYPIVESMAADLGCSVTELIADASLRNKITKTKYISATAGEFTIGDILKELDKPGRDPRSPAVAFRFDEAIRSMEDLKVGMRVPGIVTNITNFGAFVDIGVKQDGLVHISSLRHQYVKDPNEVVRLQQQVMVTVTEVDVKRKRIALSMKEDLVQARKSVPPKEGIKKTQVGDAGASFEDKLQALKKKFK